ncbi:transcriptional regulator [Salmonella enterica subsp. diarizonae]|uniref:Transcriptional regulator n=1 Tax=Salmonella enterica TaxID=28901 RepID=A0A5T7Y5M4_SALER|nr:transcriptional regulator [Salmonella enterica]EBY6850916.1 transcriptional regulator [Salmonella enterica subsp. enterica serovar Bonn]ECF6107360.1 transcriptional regulator [Salmonella enterica subsp. diarizonae]ECI4401592.1 transcriptional regulator [Salmonella enterica subsp. diarizonae]ECJ2501781.1 transcriptional regulator [Salmonella enterica subsp. diarizonae]
MTALKIADQRSHVTMSSREIAKLTRKEHKHVIRDIWEMLNDLYSITKDGPDLGHKKNQMVTLTDGVDVTIDSRSYVSNFRLDKPHVECLLTGYSAVLRMTVIKHIYKLEEQVNRRSLPGNYKEALLALVQAETEKEQIALERDQAIETKAWIGEKREATAMATASAAVREKNKLAERLGESKNYAAIIPVEKKLDRKFKWQPLRKWCRENDVTPHDVDDPRFGSVKSWPRAAWLAVYAVDLRKLF